MIVQASWGRASWDRRWAAWALHLSAVAAALVFLAWRPGATDAAPLRTLVAWAGLVIMMSLTPRWPALGLVLYGLVSTLVLRYRPESERAVNIQMLAVLAGLSFTGAMAWRQARDGWAVWRPRHWLAWLMLALLAWVSASWAWSWVRGAPAPIADHHPRAFFEAAAVFGAAACLGGPVQSLAVCAAVCFALTARTRLLSRGGVWRQEDVAVLLVMAIPLAMMLLAGASDAARALPSRLRAYRTAIAWSLRIGAVLLILNFLKQVWATQDRAAVVAMGVLAVAFAVTARRMWLALLVIAVLGGAGLWYLPHTEVGQRFMDIPTNGPESGSAMERVEMWHAGMAMVRDHPILGVGPGQFANLAERYDVKLSNGLSAHNNLMAMASETGAPGLILYVLVFGGALAVLWRLRNVAHEDWPGPAARLLMVCLSAYLAKGMFYPQHDLPLAYLIAGWALGLDYRLRGWDGAQHAAEPALATRPITDRERIGPVQ